MSALCVMVFALVSVTADDGAASAKTSVAKRETQFNVPQRVANAGSPVINQKVIRERQSFRGNLSHPVRKPSCWRDSKRDCRCEEPAGQP